MHLFFHTYAQYILFNQPKWSWGPLCGADCQCLASGISVLQYYFDFHVEVAKSPKVTKCASTDSLHQALLRNYCVCSVVFGIENGHPRVVLVKSKGNFSCIPV